MPRLLITGGSGYIGGELLAQLNDPVNSDLKPKLEIFAVYRQERHRDKLIALGCEPVQLNIGDETAVKEFIRDKRIEIAVELTEPFGIDLAVSCIEALKSVSNDATLITTGGAKLFASFSGFDTSNTTYDDADPLNTSTLREPEWAISKVAQENERQLFRAGKASGVSTHIVIPPMVYGQSRTFGNPLSIQIVGLCKVMLKYGRPVVIPATGSLPQTYAICHVEDIASMYIALIKQATRGAHAASGLYFAENGQVEWKKLAMKFAEGLNLNGEVTEATPEMMRAMTGVLGVEDETWVRPWIGGRTNIKGRAGRNIGLPNMDRNIYTYSVMDIHTAFACGRIVSASSCTDDAIYLMETTRSLDAALHYEGAGTVGASLRAGSPTLIKPWFGDPFFWAHRVTELQVGLKVPSLGSDDIARCLRTATSSTSMIEKAKLVGQLIRSENGVDDAVAAIQLNITRAAADRTKITYQK